MVSKTKLIRGSRIWGIVKGPITIKKMLDPWTWAWVIHGIESNGHGWDMSRLGWNCKEPQNGGAHPQSW